MNFRSIFQKLTHKPIEDKLFNNVIGYTDIKKLLAMAIINKEGAHFLLTGPPATSKTVFLLEISKLNNSYFADCTSTTGAGIIDYLFEYPKLEYLLLDEIDKLDRRSQTVLLNLMETGMLIQTQSKKGKGQRSQKMNIKVFATSNESERLIKALKSRFMELSLNPYDFKEFEEISIRLLAERYRTEKQIACKIANEVWHNIETRDIRDVIQIGRLAKKAEDVSFIARTLNKYRPKD